MALLLSVVRAAVPLRSAACTATRTFALSAPDAEERLSCVLANLDRVKTGDGVPTASFAELGFTPLEIAEVVVAVEDEFGKDTCSAQQPKPQPTCFTI